MTKDLTKTAYWNPHLDFAAAMKSLPDGADLTVPKERNKPITDYIDETKRVKGQRWDYASRSSSPLRVPDQDKFYL